MPPYSALHSVTAVYELALNKENVKKAFASAKVAFRKDVIAHCLVTAIV